MILTIFYVTIPMKTNIKQLTSLGLLASIMLILGYIEKLFPLVPAMPAIRLGLSNIVLLFAMVLINPKSTWYLLTIKILLGGLLFMGPFGTIYTAVGSFTSLIVMLLLYKSKALHFIGISVAGSIAHTIAQALVAIPLLGLGVVMAYAPILLVSALVSGAGIGIVSQKVISHMKKIDYQFNDNKK